MKRFGYLLDPLCVAACVLYLLNRLWLRDYAGGAFLQGYFNDLLLIPAGLPLILWLQRRLGLRTDDRPPRWGEIALHLAAWGIMAEAIVPHLSAHSIADWRDLAAYSIGALFAGTWWQVGLG
ncbi:hypothetical protein [Opitutus terrae]|uniref:VanZ-like domain-containing protein n=1 Tax=Opitutus terrae (strain DSM 11246 / JCM 15787 / PB90-1) TaxID=452637 RepID=B1ZXR3_OPITP|nr:hypothetical protein [Opitutus terrae]ACB74285.1 hypothetical protein Oter_0997 [Opitutus terrae PB90-1]